jgi:hypothetical protein
MVTACSAHSRFLGHDLWRLMAPAADPGTEADPMTDAAVLAEVARLLGERTGCDPSLVRDPEWVTSFRIHRRLAETTVTAGSCSPVTPPMSTARSAVKG